MISFSSGTKVKEEITMGKLNGKVAVVTGAASGMGQQIAILFAKEGAKVVVADLNLEAGQKTVELVEKEHGTGLAVVANVTKQEDIENMINQAIEAFGTLDILVNNAGIMDNFVPAGELTDELWDKVFAINTTGVMRATREALHIFEEKGQGVIVNIASAGDYLVQEQERLILLPNMRSWALRKMSDSNMRIKTFVVMQLRQEL